MTKDRGEKDVLMAERIRTGRHFSKFGNEHEAKSIVNELLPYCKADSEELGIIAPYNDQVNLIQNLAPEGIAVATVHKFQGREKETIIYSATDDQLNSEFSDNPNIVNVAVSRAKKQFFLAVSGEEITDGYTYHHEGTKQKERDDIKDRILASYNIPILRLSTRESGERERIVAKLSKVYA